MHVDVKSTLPNNCRYILIIIKNVNVNLNTEILKKMYDETTGLPHFSIRKYKAREDHSNMGLAEKMEYKLVDYIKKNEYKIGHLDNQYGISIIWGRPGGGPHWNQYRKGWSARIVDYCQACSGD